MTHGSLFSGIEGFGLAAHWMGWENKFHCEWNPFGAAVNKYYWPNAESYHDVTKTDFTLWRGRIDVLTGGFPCQPFSAAGKRKGTDDARYLWPEMLRAIREIRPRWVIGENVYGLVNWDGGLVFDTVCADLENEGFEVWPVVLPAAGVNAPHRRDRVWFIARSISADTESLRINRAQELEDDQRQGGERWGCDTNNNGEIRPENRIWFAADTFNDGRSNEPFQPAGCFKQVESTWEAKECGNLRKQRPSQNPNSDGRGSKEWQSEPGIGEQRHTCTGDNEWLPANDGEAGADTHTGHTGLQGREQFGTPDEEGQIGGEQPSGSATELYQITDWTIWPTVPPLCSGDDGFSELLDADTVSEVAGKRVRNAYSWWRTESIKAGGNAIVPQVALQIFKTIVLFENQNGYK